MKAFMGKKKLHFPNFRPYIKKGILMDALNQNLKQNTDMECIDYFLEYLLYLFMNLSTRPAVSTSFNLPVKKG